MNRLLALVSRSDRSGVDALAERLREDVRNWADPAYSGLGERLVRSLCVTVASIAPKLGPEKAGLLVRFSMWCYLVDDRLDRPDVPALRLDQLGRTIQSTLRTQRAIPPDDPVATELAAMLGELRAHAPDRELVARFSEELGDGVLAAVEHAKLSRRIVRSAARRPSAEQYLDVASRHIHYRSFALCLLILCGEKPTPDAMGLVEEALSSASRAVRLMNDLRTARKDGREGSLNILALRTRAGRRTSVEQIERQVEHHMRVHDVLLDAASALGLRKTSASVLANSLRVAVGVYRITDLTREEPWPSHRGSTAAAVPEPRVNSGQRRLRFAAPFLGLPVSL